MALDIPSQIIVLTARYLLDDFDTYHYKYAEIVSLTFEAIFLNKVISYNNLNGSWYTRIVFQ